jgi:predicted phage tail protein
MGPSGYSNTVEVIVPPVNPPAAPGSLAAAMDGAYVVLSWQDNSTNESQFYVERCQGAGCTSFAGTGSSNANVTTWTDFNAAAGQSYSYRVRAWNADGYSAYSNIATIVTPGGSPVPPPAPGNLTAQALNKSQIMLTWTNNSLDQAGVQIERCLGTKCTNFVQIASVAGSGTSYTDSGLAAYTFYRYRVRAYNLSGDSPYSNIAGTRTAKR